MPATTLGINIWIDLPLRQYVTVLNLCQRHGAHIHANTVAEPTDGSLVNFLYLVDGLRSFAAEYRHAPRLSWLGAKVAVLPLQRIYRSKQVVGRPKDLAHLPLINQVLRSRKRAAR